MKEFKAYDIVIGMNDTAHFIHEIKRTLVANENITLKKYIDYTEDKRRWSLINPGFLLGTAYMYFVFGYEKKILEHYDISTFLKDIVILENNGEKNIESFQTNKSDFIKHKLRNSIAHCRFNIELRTENGKIENDSQVWFVFEDEYKGKNKVKFEMTFPTFGNLVEKAGTYVFNSLSK